MVKCLLGQPVVGQTKRMILVPFCETTIEGSYDESCRDEKTICGFFQVLRRPCGGNAEEAGLGMRKAVSV